MKHTCPTVSISVETAWIPLNRTDLWKIVPILTEDEYQWACIEEFKSSQYLTAWFDGQTR